jgi:hypothetical protein
MPSLCAWGEDQKEGKIREHDTVLSPYCVLGIRKDFISQWETREKVRSKRINLEGNTHAQEINVSQCPV